MQYFPNLAARGIATTEGVSFDTWLNVPGMPPAAPNLSAAATLSAPAVELARSFLEKSNALPFVDIKEWKLYQVNAFLNKIIDTEGVSCEIIDTIDDAYHISISTNAEIRFRWCKILIKNNHFFKSKFVLDFLLYQGKQKFTGNLYIPCLLLNTILMHY